MNKSILLEIYIATVHIIQCRPQKVCWYCAGALLTDSSPTTFFIVFELIRSDHIIGSKQSLIMCDIAQQIYQDFKNRNTAVLFSHKPILLKISFVTKNNTYIFNWDFLPAFLILCNGIVATIIVVATAFKHIDQDPYSKWDLGQSQI